MSERSVLLFTYTGSLTVGEIEASLVAYFPLLDETRTTVHSIFDVTRLVLLPPKLMSTFIAKRAVYQPLLTHPMMGLSMVVIGSSLVGAVTYIAASIFSTDKVRVVHTLEAAWAQIEAFNQQTVAY